MTDTIDRLFERFEDQLAGCIRADYGFDEARSQALALMVCRLGINFMTLAAVDTKGKPDNLRQVLIGLMVEKVPELIEFVLDDDKQPTPH